MGITLNLKCEELRMEKKEDKKEDIKDIVKINQNKKEINKENILPNGEQPIEKNSENNIINEGKDLFKNFIDFKNSLNNLFNLDLAL